MHLFYTPDIGNTTYQLAEQESKHCIRVLRLKKGDRVHLVDGRGGFYEAYILSEDPKRCLLGISSKQQRESDFPYFLHVAIAPTKNLDRFEWFVEKATELGISMITPIICDRSERRDVKTERLERVIVSAMKQSYKAYLPVIKEPQPFKSWIRERINGFKGIAHCMDEDKIRLWDIPALKLATIAVGPEGDFTPQELELAKAQGYRGLDLGMARLRTETAGVAVVHGIQMLNEMKG